MIRFPNRKIVFQSLIIPYLNKIWRTNSYFSRSRIVLNNYFFSNSFEKWMHQLMWKFELHFYLIYLFLVGKVIVTKSKNSFEKFRCKYSILWRIFFQILWKSRCDILASFPSHTKKLRSKLRFGHENLHCGFFHSYQSRKNITKQLFLSK